jgi:hypothetical protein
MSMHSAPACRHSDINLVSAAVSTDCAPDVATDTLKEAKEPPHTHAPYGRLEGVEEDSGCDASAQVGGDSDGWDANMAADCSTISCDGLTVEFAKVPTSL